ncbi:HNH endonuclease [Priestia megaterium]|uniref:HNH endonuclease n=1 Tax=Priestia megaterium TaxID=1404 RepID=UPI00196A87E8|nr:HNH endonuclease [Priestia megaterium]
MAYSSICKCGRFSDQCQCKRNKEQSEVAKLRNTDQWKRKTRPRIIRRDGAVCQRCLIKYGLIESNELTVHHIKSAINHIELFFDEDNLICLCDTCNKQLGTKDELDFSWSVPEAYEFKL